MSNHALSKMVYELQLNNDIFDVSKVSEFLLNAIEEDTIKENKNFILQVDTKGFWKQYQSDIDLIIRTVTYQTKIRFGHKLSIVHRISKDKTFIKFFISHNDEENVLWAKPYEEGAF